MSDASRAVLPSRRGLYELGLAAVKALTPDNEPEDAAEDRAPESEPQVAAVIPLHPSAYASPARPAPWAQTPSRAA